MNEWDKLSEQLDKKLDLQEFVISRATLAKWKQVKAVGDKLQEETQYWKEKYASEKKNRNEAMTGNTEKMKEILKLQEENKQLKQFKDLFISGQRINLQLTKKLEAIFGNPIEYPCCFGEYYDTDRDEPCNQAHICKFKPECLKEVLGE